MKDAARAFAEEATQAPRSPDLARPTLRSWLCYGVAGGLLVLAVAARTPVPLFAAVPLLIAPLAALLLAPSGRTPVALGWTEAGENTTVSISGAVTVPTTLDPRDLDLEIDIPAGLTQSAPLTLRTEGPSVSFSLSLRARDPVLALLALPRVRWRDALGLVQRPLPVEGSPLPIERCPLEANRLGTLRLDRTIVLPGETRSRALGDNGDFYGVRLMMPGDSPRRINWAATARSQNVYTNEFCLERTGDVLLLLDTRPTELGAAVDARLLGIARAAGLAIADGFLHERARVGLAVFGEFLVPTPLGGGRRQRYRIREALLGAQVAKVGGPSARAAFTARRFFPPGITTVVLSSLADESTRQLVLHLRRRGYPSIVLSPSPIASLEFAPSVPADEQTLARRLAALIRRHHVAQVWAEAPVVDWQDYWSLAGFSSFLKRGVRNRRLA